MPVVVKRNLFLVVVLAAVLLVFFTMTRPAKERNRRLTELEGAALSELARLRDEAERVRQQVEAIEQDDPALLERVVRARLQHGQPGGAAR
ncbi:MAG: hypothetical protein HY812_07570 [Planctomycetes bacterium]|nr:hypothetical protein [Planctomycetota bacterium]